MYHSSSIILSEERGFQVSWCKSCKKFTLIHRSTRASFSIKELSHFVNGLRNLGEDAYSFIDFGEPRVVLLPVGFCLTRSEVNILMRLIREARNMFNAFRLIYN